MQDFLTTFIKSMLAKNDCNLLELNYGDYNHVHILFEAPITLNLTSFVNGLKSTSSRMIRKSFSERINQFYWKPVFWSKSYFIGTVSEHTTEIVRNYIKNQGKN